MRTTVLSAQRQDVYGAVTDKIVTAIGRGAGEFVMPWHRLAPAIGRPSNAQSGTGYQGINILALWAASVMAGFNSGRWATYRQWDELGAQVRRGEPGTVAVFYKPVTKNEGDEEDGNVRQRFIARAFYLFNEEQVDGWSTQAPAVEHVSGIQEVEEFITATGATIHQGSDGAWYSPTRDAISVPHKEQFKQFGESPAIASYYSTLLHELTHWSGAKHRLDRTFGTRFGDDAYAMEELVAELGAAFLCADLGISNEPRTDHASYLASWLRVLKADRRAIFTAAQKAKEATTFLSAFSSPPSPV